MYILYMIGDYNEEVLFYFSSEELAEKMRVKIATLGMANKEDLFIKKVNLITDEKDSLFDLKKINCYQFDGVNFQFLSIDNLTSVSLSKEDEELLCGNEKAKDRYWQEQVISEQKWSTYLDEYYAYIVEKNEYPSEVKNKEVFKETRHHLVIFRPIDRGKEIIQKEWMALQEVILSKIQQGVSIKAINEWLTGKMNSIND